MSAGDRDTLALAELLAEHLWRPPFQHHDGYQPNACSCGTDLDRPDMAGDWADAERIHRGHLADVILGSDWLRGVKAAVWDQGVEESSMGRWCERHRQYDWCGFDNPYRTTEDTDAH